VHEEKATDDHPVLTPAAASVLSGESAAEEAKPSWLDFRNIEWTNSAPGWAFAQAHYSADLLHDDHIGGFLIRKQSSESEEAYNERKQLADYTPHFGAVIDSLAGMLFQVEERADRRLGTEGSPGLGDVEDPGTPIGRLWLNADGAGTNYPIFWKKLAIDLIVFHLSWVVVDTDATGRFARLKMWPALNVVNWRWDNGRLVDVIVEENADVRGSIQENPDPVKKWVHYALEGWTRYRKDAKGQPAPEDSGVYNLIDSEGQAVLPIFPVGLPMKRNVGWVLARKANVIFNKESERDTLLRTANFPYLNLVADDEQFEAITEKMKKGWRALQVDPDANTAHSFIAPDPGSAKIATDVLIRKVDEFYVTAFRDYGDAAQERTATEVNQDVNSGVGAFLQLLKSAVDEAENNALFRIAQIEMPNAKARWFVNTVLRSDDFAPINIQSEIDRIKARYFGETGIVPTGREGKIAAAMKIAKWDGVEVTAEEVGAAVDMHAIKDNIEPISQLPTPPQVKAEMVIRLMASLGILDADQEVELEDGEKVKLVDIVRERAESLAEASDQAAIALSQMPTDGTGTPSDGDDE